MKAGLSLQDLVKTLDEQNNAKRDFLVDTRQLTVLPPSAEVLAEEKAVWTPELTLPDGTGEFTITGVAPRQIGDHLKIPARFWDLLRAEHPHLLAHNVNTLLRERPANRMVRCLDFGPENRVARAFLSDRYLRRDNFEVAAAALQVLHDIPDVQIPTSQVTDKHMYISAVAPRVSGEVRKGDVVQAGIRITNSEVGWGALKVEPFVLRLVCLNGMTVAKATRVYHVGGAIGMGEEETIRVLSDETLKLDDKAFFAKLADVMRAAVNETAFNAIVAEMREAAGTAPMEKPQKAMEELGKQFKLSDGENESIMHHLITGGDLTAFGALNAVTRAAQDVESYDRSMELEKVGGQILEMAGTKSWDRIALMA